jgi:hypothetical protein
MVVWVGSIAQVPVMAAGLVVSAVTVMNSPE